MHSENPPLFTIAGYFATDIQAITPLGNGLINDTYLVTSRTHAFVLQRINQQVFPEPEKITANLLALNQHSQQQTDVRLQIPTILSTVSGSTTHQDELGHHWRAQAFIADTFSLENLRSLQDAHQVGYALGHFHRLVSQLSQHEMHDTLPGFHITPSYLQHYRKVMVDAKREADAFCDNFIHEFAVKADVLETAKAQGLLPVRVIHGDPKLNNFLFAANNTIVSLIDLDTVKPGLVHYDIGDCLRSCCHDADNHFNLAVCAAILQSYLPEVKAFFVQADYDYLYAAIELLPFELGLRFYTDYLQGDRYFKVTDPQQNLQRAIAQFQLCASIMAQREAIEALLQNLSSDPNPA